MLAEVEQECKVDIDSQSWDWGIPYLCSPQEAHPGKPWGVASYSDGQRLAMLPDGYVYIVGNQRPEVKAHGSIKAYEEYEAKRKAEEAERAAKRLAEIEAKRLAEAEAWEAKQAAYRAAWDERRKNYVKPSAERRAAMYAMRRKGETFARIGQSFGICGSRAQQECMKYEREWKARPYRRTKRDRRRPRDLGGPRDVWLEWTPEMQAREFGLTRCSTPSTLSF